MLIEKIVVGRLGTNCYLIYDEKSWKTIIVDPGDDSDLIVSTIQRLQLDPIRIISTHGHFDHITAVNELKFSFDVNFSINKKDEFLLERMRSSSRLFTGFDPGPPPLADSYVKDKQKIKLGNSSFEIIETPGHTPGGICLYSNKENVLLCGDLLFEKGGVGRTDFVYSERKELERSIKKILSLPDITRVFSGHGDETTISEFKTFYSSF